MPPLHRLELLVLAGLCLFVLGFQCWCGVRWNMGFDEGWQVYLAAVEPLQKAIWEMGSVAHPPLQYLLMRPLVDIGPEPIWGRLVSILAAVPQPLLIFLLVRRLAVANQVALVGAALFAVSQSFTAIGVTARCYSLSVLFVLLAANRWLDLLPGGPIPRRRTLIAFVLFAAAAVWTEYPAGLVTFAMLGGTAAVAAGSPAFRRELGARLRTAWSRVAGLVFVGSHVAVVGYYALSYMGRGLPHVTQFFPEAGQSALDYLIAGSLQNLGYFSPIPVAAGGWALGAVVLVVLTVAVIRRGSVAGRRQAALLWCLASLWIGLWVLGLLGKYPFGGKPRHQYYLFPLLACTGIVLVDAAHTGLRRPAWRRMLLVGALAGGIVQTVLSYQHSPRGEFEKQVPWVAQRAALFREDTRQVPVLVGTFAFIRMYGAHRGLGWRYARSLDRKTDVFEIGGEQGWRLYRRRYTWTYAQVPEPDLFVALDEVCATEGIRRLQVFSPQPQEAGPQDLEAAVRARCAEHGYTLRSWRAFPDGDVFEVERRP